MWFPPGEQTVCGPGRQLWPDIRVGAMAYLLQGPLTTENKPPLHRTHRTARLDWLWQLGTSHWLIKQWRYSDQRCALSEFVLVEKALPTSGPAVHRMPHEGHLVISVCTDFNVGCESARRDLITATLQKAHTLPSRSRSRSWSQCTYFSNTSWVLPILAAAAAVTHIITAMVWKCSSWSVLPPHTLRFLTSMSYCGVLFIQLNNSLDFWDLLSENSKGTWILFDLGKIHFFQRSLASETMRLRYHVRHLELSAICRCADTNILNTSETVKTLSIFLKAHFT